MHLNRTVLSAIAPPLNMNCRAKRAIALPLNSEVAPFNTNCQAKRA
ncbi:hypothetical protein [Nostoc sp.]